MTVWRRQSQRTWSDCRDASAASARTLAHSRSCTGYEQHRHREHVLPSSVIQFSNFELFNCAVRSRRMCSSQEPLSGSRRHRRIQRRRHCSTKPNKHLRRRPTFLQRVPHACCDQPLCCSRHPQTIFIGSRALHFVEHRSRRWSQTLGEAFLHPQLMHQTAR